VVTDQGNFLLDADFGSMTDPEPSRTVERPCGIVEHGLFLGWAHDVIVAGRDGIRI